MKISCLEVIGCLCDGKEDTGCPECGPITDNHNTEVKPDDVLVLNEYKQDYQPGDQVETPRGYGKVIEDLGNMWQVQVEGHSDVYSADELRLVLHNPGEGGYQDG